MKLTNGLVRILKADGNTAGTGFIVSDSGLIATCAHVVERAGGGPGEIVTVAFYVNGEKWVAHVEPGWWRKVDAEDVAILRLGQPLADVVEPLLLGSSRGTAGHGFRSYGFPQVGPYEEFPADGDIIGEVKHPQGRRTLVFRSEEIAPGMSGAPLFDTTTRRVVGMVNSFPAWTDWERRDERRIAGIPLDRYKAVNFATPSELLLEICPDLQFSDLCPYQGLAAFIEEDAPFFFGRRHLVETLIAQLRTSSRFLVVVGPSGSGKTSVVQAGLFPALREGRGPGGRAIQIFSLRPEADPYKALAQTGLIKTKGIEVLVRDYLEQRPEIERLYLFIDQFEELFTLVPEETQKRFMADLLRLLESDVRRITVILAVRADFYGHFLESRAWAERLALGQVTVSSMDREELRQAVEEPVCIVGLRFQEGLALTIIEDASLIKYPLPLLESALEQLWKERWEGELTHSAYQKIGRVAGAVSQWAEDVFSGLPAEARKQVRRIFTRLIHYGPDPRNDTRRSQPLTTLVAQPEEEEVIHRLVQHLADERLLLTGRDPITGNEQVEIVHDALLWIWGRLKLWREEDRGFLIWQQQLHGRMKEWLDNERKDDSLIQDKRFLRQAERWLKDRPTDLNPTEKEYIEKSITYQKRRRFFFIMGGTILLIALIAFVLVILSQSEQISSVDAANRLIRAERLSSQASSVLERDPELALLLARAAVNTTYLADGTYTDEAQASLYQALLSPYRATLYSGEDIWTAHFNFDGSLLMTFGCERIDANTCMEGATRFWDGITGELLSTRKVNQFGSYNFFMEVSSNGKYVATTSGGEVLIWDFVSGKLLHTLAGHETVVRSVRFSPDNTKTITVSHDSSSAEGDVRLWDVETGKQITALGNQVHNVTDVSFSADNRRFSTVDGNGGVVIWNTDSGEHLTRLNGLVAREANFIDTTLVTVGQTGAIQLWNGLTGSYITNLPGLLSDSDSLLFDPNSTIFAATYRENNIVRLWDGNTHALVATLTGQTNPMAPRDFSPDGSRLATTECTERHKTINKCINERIDIWNVTTGKHEASLVGHISSISSVAFNFGGTQLATTSEDGEVRLWDLNLGWSSVNFMGHLEYIQSESVKFSLNDMRLVTLGGDGTVRLWDPVNVSLFRTLTGHTGQVLLARFSPDGEYLATGSNDKTAILWNAETSKLIATLEGNKSGVSSLDFSPGGTYLVTISHTTVQLWNGGTGAHITTFQEPMIPPLSIAFSPDSKRLAVADSSDDLWLWDSKSGDLISMFEGNQPFKSPSISFSLDNGHLAAAYGNEIRMLDGVTGELITNLSGHQSPVIQVSFNHKGTRLVTVSENPGAILWDGKTGELINTLYINQYDDIIFSDDDSRLVVLPLFAPFISIYDGLSGKGIRVIETNDRSIMGPPSSDPNATRVVTFTYNGSGRLWDATTGALIAQLQGPSDWTRIVKFSPDGTRIAMGNEAGNVWLWDAITGGLLMTLEGHEAEITSLEFSPNSKYLVTSSEDGTARLWLIYPGNMETMLADAARRLHRDFTEEECRLYFAEGGQECLIE